MNTLISANVPEVYIKLEGISFKNHALARIQLFQSTARQHKISKFKSVNNGVVSVRRNPVSPSYIVSLVRFAWHRKVYTITFSSSACGEHNSSFHLSSSCIYLPLQSLVSPGLARRHCSRYINFHDRSSLKNKSSSLSSGDEVKEWFARVLPSDSLRIQIISPFCFCVHLCRSG